MLPRFDDPTLSKYLLSVATAIHEQINRGLSGDAVARLRECATIAARVAQQLDDRANAAQWTSGAEAAALIGAEADFDQAEIRRAQSGLGPPSASARHIDAESLERYLRMHRSGGQGLRLREARLIPGGRCKVTALVSQSGAVTLPDTFIFRQDWQGGATETSVTTEFALLERVAAGGIRAPRPLLLEADSAALGAPFILLERMPGTILGSLFTPPGSRHLGLQLASQIGRLHSLPVEQFRGLIPEISTDPAVLSSGIAAFATMQATVGMRSKLIDRAIEWLSDHLSEAGHQICVTHNDLGFHNCLVQGEELTAVLDWELAALSHPAADLGYVRPFIPRMLPWKEFVDAYWTAGGCTIEAAPLRFHTIWSAVRLYGLIMQARAALAQGLVSDVEITFACSDSLMLLFRALANELQDAGAL